jgi:hypothetical protein
MEVTWALLTFMLAQCNTAESVYILRFFIGLAESTFYPGMQYDSRQSHIIVRIREPTNAQADILSVLGTVKMSLRSGLAFFIPAVLLVVCSQDI